ncbi:peptidyl-prolyl cis-trans isomerase FKBP9 isoform X1 [Anolis carolinensis]|uniref:peptidylprolyl isomerase n=1 Tax=Anolis carolinensis TaxID=28377 RepID=G1KIV7_ANOCA|nr:PREDICTED: peptidyl-prolyl cis-trans isomerase FKBP9 isoform X1 [Anolis carolinensis]|eukprot:XP_003222311.1 PREDICTED: peptidyl-prolyl cis-trans isomerase FKBP9 isoform X1 [Anolis carolinensis]
MPSVRRETRRPRSPLLLALLVSCVACQAPPVPASEEEAWDGQDVHVERSEVPPQCPRSARAGDFVRYHYLGAFPGGAQFDSSYDRGSTFNVVLGKGQLIAGMDKALLGMCVNERRFVKIPPHLGYGNEGVAGVVPPNSILHFDVLMVDIWNSEDQVQIQTYYTPENCTRTIQVSDFVRYHYNGTFLDGTLFDSSHNRMRTYDTYVGIGWLIPGMDKGLLGMCVGEKRIITVPPFLAYGEDGDGKEIPGQASLVFDVVLLDLHNPKDTITVEKQYVPESCERQSQVGDFLRYHYNGTLLDGTLFDSSYSRNRTYDTYIGKGYVIAGMDEGLLGVCIGEKRRITIPPHLGYGEEGRGNIPGSAVLVFNIHIIDFHNPSDSVAITTHYKPSNCSVLSKKGDYLKYHYNASLLDGTLLDSTVSLGKTYNIVLGSGQVVLGMDMGLRDMCVGEKRTVIIPPHLGYGEAGVEGEVPGSAVLVFDIELHDLVSGLPEGYMFVWHDEVSPKLFEEIDKDNNGEVLLEEFTTYIHEQVQSGKGKLAPGFDSETIVKNMFTNQDRNGDGKITAEEFRLKDQEPKEHDEL